MSKRGTSGKETDSSTTERCNCGKVQTVKEQAAAKMRAKEGLAAAKLKS